MYNSWKTVLMKTYLSDSEESTDEQKSKRRRGNLMIMSWHIVCAIRLGFSVILIRDPDSHHLFGHTLMNSGNQAMLISCLAGIAIAQCAMCRWAAHRLLLNDGTRILQVVRQIISEEDLGLRHRKMSIAMRIRLLARAGEFAHDCTSSLS